MKRSKSQIFETFESQESIENKNAVKSDKSYDTNSHISSFLKEMKNTKPKRNKIRSPPKMIKQLSEMNIDATERFLKTNPNICKV